MKRSSCASGSANVPSYSMGFWVAMTRNGSGIRWVTPSMVACRSSMHSRSADCVLGVARLISSASTIWAMIGPGLNSNSWVFWLKMERPVTSEGSRSGVNWMRRKLQPKLRAMALARTVLPVPGTSSMSRWPWQSSATRARRTASCLPTMTRSTLAMTFSPDSWIAIGGASSWFPLGVRCGAPDRRWIVRQTALAGFQGLGSGRQLEPGRHQLAAHRHGRCAARATVLDDDGHGDARRLDGREANEPGVRFALAAELGRAALAGGGHAGHLRRTREAAAQAALHGLLHGPRDRLRLPGIEDPSPNLRRDGLDPAVRGAQLVHDVRPHQRAAVSHDRGHERHLQRRDERLRLAVGSIRQLDVVDEAVTAVKGAGRGWHVEGDGGTEPHALAPGEEPLATDVEPGVGEPDVAGDLDGPRQIERALAGLRVMTVAHPEALHQEAGPLLGGLLGIDGLRRDRARPETGHSGGDLQHRSGRVAAHRGPIEERGRLGRSVEQVGEVGSAGIRIDDPVRIEGGRAGQGQDAPGSRLDRDDGAAFAAQQRHGGTLQAHVQRELHVLRVVQVAPQFAQQVATGRQGAEAEQLRGEAALEAGRAEVRTEVAQDGRRLRVRVAACPAAVAPREALRLDPLPPAQARADGAVDDDQGECHAQERRPDAWRCAQGREVGQAAHEMTRSTRPATAPAASRSRSRRPMACAGGGAASRVSSSDRSSPSTIPLASNEEPPYETKGSVIPVSGMSLALPATMIAAWTTTTSVTPAARRARKSSRAADAMRSPRSARTT